MENRALAVPAWTLLLVYALALAVYGYTLAPGVIWGDSASLALQVREAAFDFGTAGDHPLYVLVGLAFARLPGDLARNLNLLSAVCAAGAVTTVFAIVCRLTGSPWPAAAAAAALGLSHAFWLHAVTTEVYALHALLLALVIALALEWSRTGSRVWLLAALGALALGITNHLVLGSIVPALVFLILATRPELLRDRRAWTATAGALAGAGLLLIAVPGVRAAAERVWWGPPPIWHYFAFRTEPQAFVRECGYYLLYLAYQFPIVALALGGLGIVALWRRERRVAAFLLIALGANALLFLKTTEWTSPGSTKYTFYIHDYVIFALFVGVGAQVVMARRPSLRTAVVLAVIVLPVAVYTLAPWAVEKLGVDLVRARTLAFRDNARFFLNPNKRGEHGPETYAREAFRVVKPGATIVADYTILSVLTYAQVVKEQRPDVDLVKAADFNRLRDLGPFVAGRIRRGPVYIGDRDPRYYNVESLKGRYQLIPVAPLLEIVEPRADSAVK